MKLTEGMSRLAEIARDITDAFDRFCARATAAVERTSEGNAESLVQEEVGPHDSVAKADLEQIARFENEGGASSQRESSAARA